MVRWLLRLKIIDEKEYSMALPWNSETLIKKNFLLRSHWLFLWNFMLAPKLRHGGNKLFYKLQILQQIII